jgi:hypothetical protein
MHLVFHRFSRRWVAHDLTDNRKQFTCEISEDVLNVLLNNESTGFPRVATGDESWFSYYDQSVHCYAKSHVELPPKTKTTIAAKRAMATIFVTETKLLILDVLPGDRNSIKTIPWP